MRFGRNARTSPCLQISVEGGFACGLISAPTRYGAGGLRWFERNVIFDFTQNALHSRQVKRFITVAKKTQHITFIVEPDKLFWGDAMLADIEI